MPPHPDDHAGHQADRDQPDDGLQGLLPALRQAALEQVEDEAEPQAQRHGRGHAEPDLADGVPAALADQEGGHDADDQRGLEALAQADDEGGQHGGGPGVVEGKRAAFTRLGEA